MNTLEILRSIPFIAVLILLGMFIQLAKKAMKKDKVIYDLKKEINFLNGQKLVLLDAAGKDVLLWNQEDNRNLDQIARIMPSKTIIISGADLYVIYSERYSQGRDDHAGIINHVYPQCCDKAYDGLYRDHVNELTQIAKEFKDMGQLRARIADNVINFRNRMGRMQGGLEQIPGKKNPPANVTI